MIKLTKIHKTIPATELRKHLAQYLAHAKKGPVVVSTDRGADARVILDASLYNRLVERLEDQLDTQELTRLVAGDSGEYTALSKL